MVLRNKPSRMVLLSQLENTIGVMHNSVQDHLCVCVQTVIFGLHEWNIRLPHHGTWSAKLYYYYYYSCCSRALTLPFNYGHLCYEWWSHSRVVWLSVWNIPFLTRGTDYQLVYVPGEIDRNGYGGYQRSIPLSHTHKHAPPPIHIQTHWFTRNRNPIGVTWTRLDHAPVMMKANDWAKLWSTPTLPK